MSVLSDKTIEALCTPPFSYEHIVERHLHDNGMESIKIDPDRCIDNNGKPMIEPFVAHQVSKEGEQKILSYGTSSYGYDVRLDRNFKIFSNAKNALLDPLNPTDDCYIDHEGDYCIIPPNSYILGHTIERFDIPRNVMVIAVGKCLAGDTLITIPETGEIKRMDETSGVTTIQGVDDNAQKISNYKTDGLVCNGELPMVTLTTKRGLSITATESHPIRKWHGWTPISELKIGDRIAVARSENVAGSNVVSPAEARLLGFMTADGQCRARSPVFTKSEPAVMARFISDAENMGFAITFRDAISVRLVNDKIPNRTSNKLGKGAILEKNRALSWLESHDIAESSKNKTVPIAIQTATLDGISAYLCALFTCDGGISMHGEGATLEYYTTSDMLAQQLQILLRRFGLFFTLVRTEKTLYDKKFPLCILRTSTVDTICKFSDCIGFISGSKKANILNEITSIENTSRRSNWDTLPPEAWNDIDRIFKRLGISYRSVGMHPQRGQSVSLIELRRANESLDDPELDRLINSDVIWDVVKAVEPAETQLAYDYTVPEVHNFIANGIVVHNSTLARLGGIVNVTPIEPGFRGTVVVEIANCTTLPLKVYANQGIAQFMFFIGDQPCKTTYADKQGKYQNQSGLTTARL